MPSRHSGKTGVYWFRIMEMLTNSKACNQTARLPVKFFPQEYALIFYVWSHFFLSTKGSQLKGNHFHVFLAAVKGDVYQIKLHINVRRGTMSPFTTFETANEQVHTL